MNTKEEGKKYPKDHPYMIRLDEVLCCGSLGIPKNRGSFIIG